MIKVLFMIHDLGQGGAEKVLINLVNNMDPSKFDITVLSLFGGGVNEQFLNENICYKTVFSKAFPGNSKIMKIFSPKLLHKLFVKDKYDIEISYLEGPSARIISGCTNPQTKLVSWIHVEQHTKKIAAQAFRSYSESLECYKKFHQTVCVSDYVRQDFLSIYPEIRNAIVLYNTNETAQILKKKDEVIEQTELFKENEIRICGVGKIMPAKGFDKLARIHKRLRDEGYPVHTYILGTGSDQLKIEAYLKEHQLEDSYTFLGYQTNPYKYVAKCDLFVCASIAEGFSTATTEALIVGTPVVTTLVSGMTEMLGEHNEYGIITENSEEALYQGIKKLLDNPAFLAHYKKIAQERGRFFSTENTVRAVEEMLDNCFEVEKTNTKVLLLTGTIKPFVDVKHNNAEERLQEYRKVIFRYITESNFDSIVFAENSGYPFNTVEFNKLASKHGKVFEYLDVSSNVDKRNMSTGEAVLMKKAFLKSDVLKDAEEIWKSTGRIYIRNINKLLQEQYNEKKNQFLYSRQYNSIQTWFFRATVSDLKKYFLADDTIENMSNSCIEFAWMECYQKNKEFIKIDKFDSWPDAEGINSSGNAYTASRIKQIIRNVLLRLGYFTVR